MQSTSMGMVYVPAGYECHIVFDIVLFVVPQRYQDLRMRGRGTQGYVCSAFDGVTQKFVAIKKIRLSEDNDDDDRETFRRANRELQCMLRIRHPHIVTFLSAFTPHTTHHEMKDFYIVSELMEANLKKLDRNYLSHEQLANITWMILKAVNHLHANRIAHRDLKPSNVLLNREGTIRICNFGQSNSYDPFMQTPYIVMRHYRAPEILLNMSQGNSLYGRNVDVWAIGCILALLVRGAPLFPGADHPDQWMRIIRVLGTPSSNFTGQLEENVARFLVNIQRYEPCPFESVFPDECFPPRAAGNPHKCAEARDLLQKMLVIDPAERISVEHALQHPYICDDDDEDERPRYPLGVSRTYTFDRALAVDEWRSRLGFDADSQRSIAGFLFDSVKRFENVFDIHAGTIPPEELNFNVPDDTFTLDP